LPNPQNCRLCTKEITLKNIWLLFILHVLLTISEVKEQLLFRKKASRIKCWWMQHWLRWKWNKGISCIAPELNLSLSIEFGDFLSFGKFRVH
jgi:hypothetical protein